MGAMRRERGPVGYQQWRDLLFLHWRMPRDALRAVVPRGLDLDLFEGDAYVSLIPFLIAESRPVAFPRILSTCFLETNLRTYVRAEDGEAGIYFLSLEASSLLAVAAARLLYGLPYFPAAMSMRAEGARVVYSSRRRTGRGPGLDVVWSLGEPAGRAAAGTRDHFLLERYSLYVARAGAIYRARVRHRPYPLHRVAIESLSESLLSAAGLPPPTDPSLSHHSPGVDVEIFWLERVAADHAR
jgi:uncharacterized protein YqjF (DUF2071 family)